MPALRLSERAVRPFADSQADRERGVIRSVLICGFESANGRDYPAAVFRRDYRAYEGRPVNCDHGREATVDRRLGWFENVAPGADGRPRGDLHLLKSHPMYDRVMETAERNPSLYGFSHVAMCDVGRKNGREVVEAIRRVESIDLVAEPATTRGLFEHRGQAVTLREYLDRLAPRLNLAQVARARALAEMEGMGELPVGDAPADDAATDLDQAISDAFKQAMHAQIDALMDGSHTVEDLVKKIKALAKAHGKLTGSDDAPGDDDAGGGDEPEPPSEESRRRPDQWQVLRECRAAKFDPTETQLELLATQPDAAKRAAFVAESKAQLDAARRTDERPEAPGRKTPPAKQTTTETVPTGAKAFGEYIRG